ncbi:unnamed protein product [Lathyrus sativus]|nr:unnamed protein product [Lathyrus sativus]
MERQEVFSPFETFESEPLKKSKKMPDFRSISNLERLSFEGCVKLVQMDPSCGSEMPSWCNNQSEGDSIRIDLSPIMPDNDNNIYGIACCAVFSAEPLQPNAFHDNIHNKRSRQKSGIRLICKYKNKRWPCGVIPSN